MRGTISVTADNADADAGSVIDSMPLAASIGTTISSASVERPGRETSTRGGLPSTSAVGRPSRRAPRTSSPDGIWMLTHPCFKTSIVNRASPVTVSPFTRSVVVDARQRGIDWRRQRVRRRRKRACPQRPIVVERQHHPAVGGRRLLRARQPPAPPSRAMPMTKPNPDERRLWVNISRLRVKRRAMSREGGRTAASLRRRVFRRSSVCFRLNRSQISVL